MSRKLMVLLCIICTVGILMGVAMMANKNALFVMFVHVGCATRFEA